MNVKERAEALIGPTSWPGGKGWYESTVEPFARDVLALVTEAEILAIPEPDYADDPVGWQRWRDETTAALHKIRGEDASAPDVGVVEGAAGDLDAIRKRSEAAAQGYRHTPQWAVDVLALVADREALLRETAPMRKQRDSAYARADLLQARVGVLEGALPDLAQKMDEAAARWRDTAAKQRSEGSKSSMCGEEGVPSHVISMARAISFEGAAQTVRAVLAGGEAAGQGEGE